MASNPDADWVTLPRDIFGVIESLTYGTTAKCHRECHGGMSLNLNPTNPSTALGFPTVGRIY